MNYDIVGTLNQPNIALRAIIWGAILGSLVFIIKALLKDKTKLTLVLSDFISALLFGGGNIFFCYLYTKGVIWAYIPLCSLAGVALSYFVLLKLSASLKRTIKKTFDKIKSRLS